MRISGRVGFVGVITMLLVELKLLGITDWSWWLVLSPIWGPWVVAMAASLVLVVVFTGGLAATWATRQVRRRWGGRP